MTTISLQLDGSPADQAPASPPRRYPLSPAALDELARRTGLALPWHGTAAPAPLARALGDADRAPAPPVDGHDPATELSRLGLLSTAGRLDAGLLAALTVFASPEVFVAIDLGIRHHEPSGVARFRAWHRYAHETVTALSTTGRCAELSWWPDRHWPVELARLVRPVLPATQDEPPAAYLRLPYELLIGSAAAWREERAAVLSELLARHRGRVSGPDGTAYAPAAAEDQLRRLHRAERGRLRVTVAGAGGRRTIGIVSWVLFADGWRELVPAPGAGEPMVVVRAVAPSSLGGTVARLVAGVRP